MSERLSLKEPSGANPAWLAVPLVVFAPITLTVGLVARQTVREPYATPFFHPFFAATLQMKAWLVTAAMVLACGQLLTAARIYELIRFPPKGRFYQSAHRWSGRAASGEEEIALRVQQHGQAPNILGASRYVGTPHSFRVIPSLFIRASSVVGFMPRCSAAPRSPLTRHPVSSSTARICSRSTSSSVRVPPARPLPPVVNGHQPRFSARRTHESGSSETRHSRPRIRPPRRRPSSYQTRSGGSDAASAAPSASARLIPPVPASAPTPRRTGTIPQQDLESIVHSSRGSSRMNLPVRRSSSVRSISARVFITNGP